MVQQKNLFYRGVIDFASIIISMGWIGLWFLWPSAATSKTGVSAVPAPRTYFVRTSIIDKTYTRPDHFRKPLDPATGRNDEPGAVMERLTSPLQRSPRYLEQPFGGATSMTTLETVVPAELGPYRAFWISRQKAVEPTAVRDMRMISRLDARLAEKGFSAPSFSPEELKRFDKPWQVVMYVEVNEDGHVENVLLENGCDDQAVNSAVIKAVYRSKAGKIGSTYSGRLTLSYGFP